jgi:transposase InsO family protein
MDQMVEDLVHQCVACQVNTKSETIPPNQMTTMPGGPWEEIAIDFYGPLANGSYLLVIVNEFSRYPIVERVTRTTAEVVIRKLDSVFSLFGVPKQVRSDNGPPFSSKRLSFRIISLK